MKRIIIAISLVAVLLIGGGYLISYITFNPTIEDKALIETVKNYYNALEEQNYNLALSYCDIEKQNNDLHMTMSSRVICLQELRKHVITSFKFRSICKSNNVEAATYDKTNHAYYVPVIYQMSYINTTGGFLNETVYLSKINNVWKIVKINSSDRFACYRVGRFEYDEDIDILKPKE